MEVAKTGIFFFFFYGWGRVKRSESGCSEKTVRYGSHVGKKSEFESHLSDPNELQIFTVIIQLAETTNGRFIHLKAPSANHPASPVSVSLPLLQTLTSNHKQQLAGLPVRPRQEKRC